MTKLSLIADYVFMYALAWVVIIFSPLWLPVWLAWKLRRWVEEEYDPCPYYQRKEGE